MQPELRRTRILEHVRREGGASVTDLAAAYDVSAITVHRDLGRLAAAGLVERVHGGALPRHRGQDIRTDWSERLAQARPAKDRIGEYARGCLEDGATIFVDASTTGLALAHQIGRRPPQGLTLVTNSPAITMQLHAESVHVIVTPGEVDQNLRLIGGRWTTEFLAGLAFTTAFVSAAGITLEQGLATTRRDLADVVNAARKVATRTVGLIDASKFGRTSLLAIAPAADLDAIVTDDGLPPDVVERYRRAGVNLAVAGGPSGR